MKIDRIDSEVKTVKPALGFRKEAQGDRAVLCLHGYNDYVEDIRYAAERISEAGYTVLAPRLSGCGTHSTDFGQIRSSDWLRKALDSYLDLRADYEHVYILGLSMGGFWH